MNKKKLLYDIKLEFNKLKEKNEEELTFLIQEIQKRAVKEPLESLICEWFALTQEVSSREIGLKHFDTQLLAGVLLHEGKIVEMKTGEGKTLVSTLPVALNALTKKGVHVVTVNDYLAERDQKWMGKIYKRLGLSVGLVKSDSDIKEKQQSYQADITYVTNSEVVFDFLRDSSAYNLNQIVQRPFNFCLIDEIDSILIDEARTPLILSESKEINNFEKLYIGKELANILEKGIDFEIDEKRKDINLTEKGYEEARTQLGISTLYDPKDPYVLEILNGLKAKYFFKLNKDYIVSNDKILIVDEFTGRIMEDRRWSMGIHEAIEVKEKVTIRGGTKTKSSITYQNFFPLYPTLAGMTGTAKTTEKEFNDIYGLEVVVLPTVKELIRKDLTDLIYQNELSKWKAVLNQSKECFEKGQPILIGTSTIEKSEFLSELFQVSKIPHQILNAKPENVTRESEIVAQAGERYGVTIATNMAGRGTDIILGGNPTFKTKKKLWELLIEKKEEENQIFTNLINNIWKVYNKDIKKLEQDIKDIPSSLETCEKELVELYQSLFSQIYEDWKIENEVVKNLGGLFVLGTERHETRRIDNQLRGRAGRQGDPGISRFFVSLEDDLIKIFGGDSIQKWVNYLMEDDNTPLESNFLTKSLENAQKKVELYNYDIRKNVFEYDEMLNTQRKKLLKARNQLIFENIDDELILRLDEIDLDKEIRKSKNEIKNKNKFKKVKEKFEKVFDNYFLYEKNEEKEQIIIKKNLYKEIWISHDLRFAQGNLYQVGLLKNINSITALMIIDLFWTEHIDRMGYTRETVNWRSYGQQNPLIEYNTAAFKSYQMMFEEIRSYMLYYFLINPLLE